MPPLLRDGTGRRRLVRGGQTINRKARNDMRPGATTRSIRAPGKSRRYTARSFPFPASPCRKPPFMRCCPLSPVFASYASIAPSGIEGTLESRGSPVEICSQGASRAEERRGGKEGVGQLRTGGG